jgi:hypothetical protein
MTLNWWKVYNVEHVMSGYWGPHLDTIRLKIVNVCLKLSNRKSEKITFANFHLLQMYLASIDCVHFEVNEFCTEPRSKWDSHKLNGSGLSYEVCCDLVEDHIVWVNGPFPASELDITIFPGGKRKEEKKWWNDSWFFRFHLEKDTLMTQGILGNRRRFQQCLEIIQKK